MLTMCDFVSPDVTGHDVPVEDDVDVHVDVHVEFDVGVGVGVHVAIDGRVSAPSHIGASRNDRRHGREDSARDAP